MELKSSLETTSDEALLRRLGELVSQSRRVEVDLVAHIGEVDARRLFARQAFPSMFAYCTDCLHLSEAEAYRRITVARAARVYPAILDVLRDGRIHLSGLARLVPLLTPDDCETVLVRATHLTTRQIETLVAELSPRPDVPAQIRKLPRKRQDLAVGEPESSHGTTLGARAEAESSSLLPEVAPRVERQAAVLPPAELVARRVEGTPPPQRPVVKPLAPERFKVQFTASAELRDKLERLTALLGHRVPNRDVAAVIEYAVGETLERLEARRFGQTKAPRKQNRAEASGESRHIPAAVRRAVHDRDGSRCCFVDDEGRRCSERHRLEFHHRRPFAMGGDHRPDNIGLLCPQHNRAMAEQDYGRGSMRRHIPGERRPALRIERPMTLEERADDP